MILKVSRLQSLEHEAHGSLWRSYSIRRSQNEHHSTLDETFEGYPCGFRASHREFGALLMYVWDTDTDTERTLEFQTPLEAYTYLAICHMSIRKGRVSVGIGI